MPPEPLVDYQRVVIMGAGAVGSIIGARLSPFIDTLLVCRGEHAAAIRKAGLKIGGISAETLRLEASDAIPSDLSSALVLVTAKTTSLARIAAQLQPVARASTGIVLACNGYRPERHMEPVLKGIPIQRILVTAGAHLVEAGRVDYWGGGGIDAPDTPAGRRLAGLFRRAGFTVELFADFNVAVWRKLAANCVINPLTALLRVRNCEVASPALDDVRRGIVEECRAAAATEGVSIPADYSSVLDDFITRSNNVSSMLQDVLRRRPTEIDDLNGAVERLGIERGFPAPLNSLFTRLVHAVEAGADKAVELICPPE